LNSPIGGANVSALSDSDVGDQQGRSDGVYRYIHPPNQSTLKKIYVIVLL